MCVGGVKLGPIMAAVGTDTSIQKEQQKKVGGMLYIREKEEYIKAVASDVIRIGCKSSSRRGGELWLQWKSLFLSLFLYTYSKYSGGLLLLLAR